MRAGKIGHLVARATVVGLLTAGAWFAATAVANAGYDWNIAPVDPPISSPSPSATDSAPAGADS